MQSFFIFILTRLSITVTAQVPLNRLSKAINDSEIVIYGEASHFLNSNHQAACELFKHIVQDRGFRVLVLESAWQLQFEAEKYFKCGKDINSFYLNAFNSKEVIGLLEWIKEWNNTHKNDQITITGYQPEQPITDITRLRNTLGSFSPTADSLFKYKSDLDAIIEVSKKYKAKQQILSEHQRTNIINDINAAIPKLSGMDRISAISLLGYIEVLTKSLDDSMSENPTEASSRYIYQHGDSIRFEIFKKLQRQFFPDKKVFMWMHNWHAAINSVSLDGDIMNGHPPINTISIGMRLKQEYGSRLYTIGTVTPKYLNDSLSGVIDSSFTTYWNDQTVFITKSDKTNATTQGSLLSPGDKSLINNYILFEQYDGILYLPHTGFTFTR